MKKVVIFASGDHSKVVFSEIIQLKKFSVIGFIDNFNKKGKINNFDILENITVLTNSSNTSFNSFLEKTFSTIVYPS